VRDFCSGVYNQPTYRGMRVNWGPGGYVVLRPRMVPAIAAPKGAEWGGALSALTPGEGESCIDLYHEERPAFWAYSFENLSFAVAIS
jgi:hypothetical protein